MNRPDIYDPLSNASQNDERGFTLIELMIVVGIIGVLVSIAGPQYAAYQRKSLQSEAKIAMSAIYSLEKSFYSEYNAYVFGMDAIGYTPEGRRRFYAHSLCWGGPWTGTVTGFSGAIGSNWHAAYNQPHTITHIYTIVGGTSYFANCTSYGNDPQTFRAYAVGQLKQGGETDGWEITENKILRNFNSGI